MPSSASSSSSPTTNGNAGGSSSTRPSHARRMALSQQAEVVPTVSNFFPIQRYYDAAQLLYEKAKDNNSRRQMTDQHLDLSYVYAKRYCVFVLQSIPQHDYYNAPAKPYKELRIKHQKQAQEILNLLQEIVNRMDQQEIERIQRYEQEQTERLEQWKQQRLKQQQQNQQQNQKVNSKQIQESAQEKLHRLLASSSSSKSTTRYRLDIDDEDEESLLPSPSLAIQTSTNGFLPPPILPPTAAVDTTTSDLVLLPPPPSYQDAVVTAASASLLQPPLKQQPPLIPPRRIPVRKLQEIYKQRFVQARNTNRIQIRSLSTYQGRVSASTNGCTVISALCAATHLNNQNQPSSSFATGITDAQIEDIIDRKCIPYLQTIRSKLGLSGAALIIPSDVHDHLVDEKILHPEYFVGAAGGNILDENHLQELCNLLSSSSTNNDNNKKNQNGNHPGTTIQPQQNRAAATLFFREHVISIIKDEHHPYHYHVIDSLPNSPHGTATRTTCIDIDHLQIYLNHYTISKFSPSNMQYIDTYPWDDVMADLDPRVFQGYVWSTTNR